MNHITATITFLKERVQEKEGELAELRERIESVQDTCPHSPDTLETLFEEEGVKWRYLKCNTCSKLFYEERA